MSYNERQYLRKAQSVDLSEVTGSSTWFKSDSGPWQWYKREPCLMVVRGTHLPSLITHRFPVGKRLGCLFVLHYTNHKHTFRHTELIHPKHLSRIPDSSTANQDLLYYHILPWKCLQTNFCSHPILIFFWRNENIRFPEKLLLRPHIDIVIWVSTAV